MADRRENIPPATAQQLLGPATDHRHLPPMLKPLGSRGSWKIPDIWESVVEVKRQQEQSERERIEREVRAYLYHNGPQPGSVIGPREWNQLLWIIGALVVIVAMVAVKVIVD